MTNLLSVSSVFQYIGYILLAIVVLLVMVLIHELGHYVAGKALKFKINEFSVGFGPKILQKKKKNGELVSLRAFPLGGYCAFEGEDENGNENPNSFNSQKPWKRLIVLFSGAFFNFLSGIIFSFILLISHGYDIIQIKTLDENSINYYSTVQEQGLKQGDVVLGVDGRKIDFVNDKYFDTLITASVSKNHAKYDGNIAEIENPNTFANDDGDVFYIVKYPLTFNIKRDGKKMNADGFVNVIYNSSGEYAGWTLYHDNETHDSEFSIQAYRYSFGESLVQCVPFAFKWAWKVLVIFFQLITGQLSIKAVGGPVTTVNMIAKSTSSVGFMYILILLPALAVNLAVFNWLPIPALDGFQMLFVGIEWIRKKPVDRKVINTINNVGLLVLLGLVLLIDVSHFIFV